MTCGELMMVTTREQDVARFTAPVKRTSDAVESLYMGIEDLTQETVQIL